MITSVSDYRWVVGKDVDDSHPHGDMDRIVVDGKIMPLRSTDHKNDLRGEDIAFLLEAAQERELIHSWSLATGPTREFTREIVASQIHDIHLTLLGVSKHALSPSKPLKEQTWVFRADDGDSVAFPYRPGFSQNDILAAVDCGFDEGEIRWPDKLVNRGDVVKREPIERLFAAANKLRIIPATYSSAFLAPYEQSARGNKVPQNWGRLSAGMAYRRSYFATRENEVVNTEYDYSVYGSGNLARRQIGLPAKGAVFQAWCLLALLEVHISPGSLGGWSRTNVYRLCKCGEWTVDPSRYPAVYLHTDNGVHANLAGMKAAGGINDLTIPDGYSSFQQHIELHVYQFYSVFNIFRTVF